MIKIWSKPNCIFCDKAVKLCEMKDLKYTKYMLNEDFLMDDLLKKFPNARTFPQITKNEEYVGGFNELNILLSE